MASRTSEGSYWDPHQLPPSSSQHYSAHYYTSVPSMTSQQQQQQQPRQAPLLNSLTAAAAESSSSYSASPTTSNSLYYGSFHHPTTQMNPNGHSAPMMGYGQMNAGGNQGGNQAGAHGATFISSAHGGPMSSAQVNVPYMGNTSMYHRPNALELGNGLSTGPTVEQMHHHQQLHAQQQQQQHAPHNHANSHHSGSPTMDGSDYGGSMKPKRRQVKNACVNCQKACKRCDEGRPCSRCVKYGLTDTCIDSSRKERKRGVKRGPYKRRATTGSQPNVNTGSLTAGMMHSSAAPSFMVMDNGLHNAPFLGHHPGSHAGVSPHLRTFRDQPGNLGENGADAGLISSPSGPASAPGSIQRSPAPLSSHEANYNFALGRDHFTMQPPRFPPRYEVERNGVQPLISSPYGNGSRSGTLPPPVSAPASSTSFSSSPAASVYGPRGLFSPPAYLSNTSATFLSANGHHRLLNDGSLPNMTPTPSSYSSSLSPRTPMTLSSNGSHGSSLNSSESSLNVSAESSSSVSPGMSGTKGSHYIHHPGPTTTSTEIPTATSGAFLNPPLSSSSNCIQPFPLHIPQSRWRNNGNNSSNGGGATAKMEQLAPFKLHSGVGSTDSDISGGTLMNNPRYHLPSPRMLETPTMAKPDSGQDVLV